MSNLVDNRILLSRTQMALKVFHLYSRNLAGMAGHLMSLKGNMCPSSKGLQLCYRQGMRICRKNLMTLHINKHLAIMNSLLCCM